MSPRLRHFVAGANTPIAMPAMGIWLAGAVVRQIGFALWMGCHALCRDPGCACGECSEWRVFVAETRKLLWRQP